MLRFRFLSCTFCLIICGALLVDPAHATEEEGLAEKQYNKAIELRRSKGGPSARQLKQAASLLKAAAGVNLAEQGLAAHDNVLIFNKSSVEISPGLYVATETHVEALKLLAVLYSRGDQGLPFNPRAAFELLKHAASLGDAAALRDRGLLLAAGAHAPPRNATHQMVFEFGQQDWPKAMLNLYFAASMNDSLAQMALGYRHAQGFGVPKSCRTAVLFYQAAAARVADMARFPYNFPRIDKVLLSTHGSKGTPPSREQELLHYQWFADMGYVDAQRAVGRILSQGGPETADRALHYFKQAAEADDADAMAHLGHMYANGIGVPVDNAAAIKWFRSGSERGNPNSHLGLGFMYLRGIGLPKDYRLAIRYLNAAAEQGHPEAWFHLGNAHLNGWGLLLSLQQAQTFFALAAKAGHVLAQYNLAMIYLRSKNQGQCELALERLKSVAERGPWAKLLQDSSDAFMEGSYDWALLGYLKASEAGYELAQANVAWMLGRDYGLPPGHSARGFVEPGAKPSPPALAALQAHQRASQQGNVESILAIGDAYYYGKGVALDWPKAFQVYTAAARFRNAQAHFNLGYMHEYGAGVPEDLALAKRNFDKAMEYLPGAAAPVHAALLSLWLHSRWKAFKPYIPQSLGWFWSGLFDLREPSRATKPLGSYLPKPSLGGFEKLVERVWITPPITSVLFDVFVRPFQDRRAFLELELLETGLLLFLIGCLWMVIWRRIRIRTARRQDTQQPPPPGSHEARTNSADANNTQEREQEQPPPGQAPADSDQSQHLAAEAQGEVPSQNFSSQDGEGDDRQTDQVSAKRLAELVDAVWESARRNSAETEGSTAQQLDFRILPYPALSTASSTAAKPKRHCNSCSQDSRPRIEEVVLWV